MEQEIERPDYIFEVSWEVCNKVGGIHTVLATRALTMVNEWQDKMILIGPDVWKGTGEHPEFKEDHTLYPAWKTYADSKGLKIKIGRWKITGNPVVVLVDFTPFFVKKDEIFRDLWLKRKVDSLSGGWDYIEPALFGYATGLIIECFYHCHLTYSDKIIAQFHEWLTGMGILYLEEHVPQIGTIFTTHATTVGRSIAGNGLPLYSKFDSYDGDHEARNLNVTAKHSLEKVAAQNVDCFATVSEITARECRHFLQKEPDMITPNGFEDFIVPDSIFFEEKRALARKKLFQVAKALTGQELPEDSLLLIKSGRYEFHNKGIDLFIDALGELNRAEGLKKDVIAFIFIPANHTGPKMDLLERMDKYAQTQNIESLQNNGDRILTHHLQGVESDPIMNRILQNKLYNAPGTSGRVKVIYVPVYLNGDDGVFNMDYYDVLVGFDISAFPSYYEPWGYTPLESIAFHIPTITTTLAGFGLMFQHSSDNIGQGLAIIDRNDNNDKDVVHAIASIIRDYETKNPEEIKAARDHAAKLSLTALWKNYILYYKKAYTIALKKAAGRSELFAHSAKVQVIQNTSGTETDISIQPVWREMVVQLQLPESLNSLYKLARNLWRTWNPDADNLSETIDERFWERYGHNPLLMLETLSFAQIKRLERNKEFMAQLNSIDKEFEEYINKPFQKPLLGGEGGKTPLIAYFCMEYGLSNSIKLYSGGLGILAGDYLKQASDSGINMVGVGLLYRNGYFRQGISLHGEQTAQSDTQSFTSLPLQHVYDKDGDWFRVSLAFPGRTVYAKVWKVEVGRIPLYLLDTDVPQNRPEDRDITNVLYGGDWDNRLKQELLLGIGGTRLLNKLGIVPDVYHYNEGHPAFAGLERLLMLVQGENISFDEALEVVKASTHFTTHTPVPAGHDTFSEDMLRPYLAFHSNLLNISWKRLMGLGRLDENSQDEKFSMSFLAARLSEEINAVSNIHEKVSKKIFSPLWKGYAEEELNIGHVTNGIHLPTWVSTEYRKLYEKTLNRKLTEDISDVSLWEPVKKIKDKVLWDAHIKLKKELIEEIKRIAKNRQENIGYALKLNNTLTDKTLVIGFARRFATYKRALLPFYDLNKLASIVTNVKCPVIFIFAGKAHPNDVPGRDMIKRIIEISKQEQFEGRILFLEDYDIELAKYLTRGVDVWLNTPEPGKEASGTSGMKAALNGVLNFSIADGWWAEANTPGNGWTFPLPTPEYSLDMQTEQDAEAFYQILENEIIPAYYERNNEDIPEKWVAMMKNSISTIAPVYSMQRMINEYMEKYYHKLCRFNKEIRENHFEEAKQLSAWKQKVTREWNGLQVISTEVYDSANKTLPLGSELNPKITLDLNNLSENDIGVEIIFIEKRKGTEEFSNIVFTSPLEIFQKENTIVSYQCKVPITRSGVYEYGFRVYPKNPLLKSQLDLPLVKWV